MNAPNAASPKAQMRLGDLLLQAGVIDAEQLGRALAEQKKWGGRLGRTLIDMGFVDEQTLGFALARHLRLPFHDLEKNPPPANVVELLPVQTCEQYAVMPVGLDAERNVLRVATSEPTDQEGLRQLGELTGRTVEAVVASATDIDRAVRRYYYGDVRQSFGVAMPGFIVNERPGPGQPARAVPAAAPVAAAPAPAAAVPSPGSAELAAKVARLEELLAQQTKVIRALVEQLSESKVLDVEAFQKRARGGR